MKNFKKAPKKTAEIDGAEGGVSKEVHIFDGASDNTFGYQWNKWDSLLSENRNSSYLGQKEQLLRRRTKFQDFDTAGKTLIECGCGGGDDTEALLSFGFSEIHSFDISTAVYRAAKYINDPRVKFSQASIYDIPYEYGSFDFAFCHRVLQHTPDPKKGLVEVLKMVKPGGYVFVHSYHRNVKYMRHFKYKYRALTKRLPIWLIEAFLNMNAFWMHWLISKMQNNARLKRIAFSYIPLEYTDSFHDFSKSEILELEKLVTFDALTPKYDNPMKWEEMKAIVEEMGFSIIHSHPNPDGSPIYLTARRIK